MPETRELAVSDLVQGEYTRTITTRTVEFTCEKCGKPSSREQYPGPKPKYCLWCLPIVEAERNAERQKRHRERRKQVRVTGSQVGVTREQVGVTISEKPHSSKEKPKPKPQGKRRRR